MSSPTPLRMVLILGALTAIGPISTDIYLPSFPAIAAEFTSGEAQVQRTLASSFLGMAIGQAFYGPLSDRFGRRWPLAFGMALFALASVGCALAPSIGALTALRLVQALGGCAGVVVARAVVRDLAEGPAMVRLMSQLMLVFGVAPILGPVIGGLLLEFLGWRAVFWLLALYGAAMSAACALLLSETLAPGRRQKSAALAPVLRTYARLLGDARFMGFALAGTLTGAGLFAYIAGSPFVFMALHGFSPQGYACLFGANAAGLMAVSHWVGRLSQRMPPRVILARAQAVAVAAGCVLVLAAATGSGGAWGIALPLFVFVGTLGGILPVAATLALSGQGKVAGSASAVLGVMQFGFGAVSGTLVSLLADGTAMPMAAMLAAGVSAATVARVSLAR